MASFIELTESQHAQKILLNLEEVTFIQVIEKKKDKSTVIHFTSSVYAEDRTVRVNEDYDTLKNLIIKANLWVKD
jgi:hypothetical protein